MQDAPTMRELVEAVEGFLREKAMPELQGHAAFHARVAANALAIVARELTLGPKANEEEKARLVSLLKADGSLEDLNRLLCEKIRAGDVNLDTPGLKDHLLKTTLDKVAIDQPKYSGFKTACLSEHY